MNFFEPRYFNKEFFKLDDSQLKVISQKISENLYFKYNCTNAISSELNHTEIEEIFLSSLSIEFSSLIELKKSFGLNTLFFQLTVV
ncbi:MAG: hypothetical protein ACOZBL_00860 [Patescibacteria group bacterium]